MSARLLFAAVCAVAAIAAAAPASADVPIPDPGASPPPPACAGALDGHVVDASTHEEVAGAIVTLDGEVVATTDESGRFALVGLCAGTHVLVVERDDYARGEQAVAVADRAASVEIELTALASELIVIEDAAPPAIDMRATTVVSGEALARTRGRALAEALAEVPGVAQLRSASGMAKPIVRGQFGRRLLLLVDGVRHRAQEWGLDHAPEVDPFVAGAITVVRGAAGVRYGPDAIGGAVLVDPPALPHDPGVAGELHLIGATNGHGGSGAARVQAAPRRIPGLAWQLEGTYKRLAAPRTPDYALDNTGAAEWSAGATAGYQRGDADFHLSYRRYQADLGVCSCLRIESADDFYAQLERDEPLGVERFRADFEIERPYQAVAHDLAVARAHWHPAGVGGVTLTYALQYDHREEFDVVRDATAGPQFDFRLTTHDADASFEHNPVHLSDHVHLHGDAGVVGMVQFHGFSGLPLVPDHRAWSAGAYAIERLVGHDFEVEAGVRYDALARTASIARQDFLRLVRSDQLAADACGGGEPDPVECASTFHTLSASLGGLYQLTRAWAVKADVSTASRPPNPDEQYLNGTSPTFPVVGLGKPDLGPETTVSASVTTTYRGDRVAAEASAFANRIADYIELAPALDADGEPIFDVLIRGTFPRFVTRPVDAAFWGADAGITARVAPGLELAGQVAVVRAKDLDDDGYLAFVPPDRVRGEARYARADVLGLRAASVAVSGSYVARQRRFDVNADLAPPPAGYFLLGAEVGVEDEVGPHTVKASLVGTNLTDARYRDYTSLLRYFADQPGWQLVLRLSVHFDATDAP